MITKAQARTIIRAQLPDSERIVWADSTLDMIIQLTLDELYSKILDEAPFFVSQLDSIPEGSITAPGYLNLATGGPLSQRFYRMQGVVINNQEYSPIHSRDTLVFGNASVASERWGYFIRGSQCWIFPLNSSQPFGSNVEIRYSFMPTAFTTLLEGATVSWADGFESAFIYEVLARLSAEPERVQKFEGIAMVAMDRLMSRVRREYVGPAVMQTTDDNLAWGGTGN